MIKVWFIMVYFWHSATFVPIEYSSESQCQKALIEFKAVNVNDRIAGKGNSKVDAAVCIGILK